MRHACTIKFLRDGTFPLTPTLLPAIVIPMLAVPPLVSVVTLVNVLTIDGCNPGPRGPSRIHAVHVRDRGCGPLCHCCLSSLSFVGSLRLRLVVDPPSFEVSSFSRRHSLCRLTNFERAALRDSSSSRAPYSLRRSKSDIPLMTIR